MIKWKIFKQGVFEELPLQLGVFPFGIIYGVMAIETGLSPLQAFLMSSIIFGGASQIVFLQLLSSGSTFFFAPSVIYDKDFFGDDLRYSLDYSFSSDLDLWMKAALKKGSIGIYDKPLVTCHIHQERKKRTL